MVKVGIIGAGFMGKMHGQVYRILPQAELVAVADLEEEKVKEEFKEVKIYKEAKELIKDKEVDLVDICLPTYLHSTYTIMALREGKHVLCEKPIALTLEEADQMIEEARKSNTKFMVAHCLRFWPEYMVLKDIFQKKELGKLIHLSMQRLSPTPVWSWDGWLMKEKKSGSALIDLHIHDVDFAQYLLGKPEKIFASGRKTERGWEHIFALFHYPEGVRVSIEGGWDFVASFPFTATYRAVFEKGCLELNPYLTPSLRLYTEKEVKFPEVKKVEANVEAGGNIAELGGYYNEIQYFVDCIEKDLQPEVVTPQQARDSLYLIWKEKESAEKGETVTL